MIKKAESAPLWVRQLRELDAHDVEKAACLLYARWFQVTPLALAERDRRWLSSASSKTWNSSAGRLPGYAWQAAGPKVILLHGWGGRASQMAYLGQALSAHGMSCVAFDAPAHGEAPGHHSNVLRMSQTLAEVIEQEEDVEAVVTHSYSLAAALLAKVELGAQFSKSVAISPSARPEARFEEFVAAIGVSEATLQAFEAMLALHLDADWWGRITPLRNAGLSGVQGLIIHDSQDRIVPVNEARELHQAWPGAKLVETEGLGHMRILSAPQVAQTVRDFL